MYAPRAFADTDLQALDRLIERDAFITLVTVDADGAPFASHLPVLYARDGDRIVIEGHWARPNPQVHHVGHGLYELGLADPRDSLEQHVPARQQAGHDIRHDFFVAHDDARDLLPHLFEVVAKQLDLAVDDGIHGFPCCPL